MMKEGAVAADESEVAHTLKRQHKKKEARAGSQSKRRVNSNLEKDQGFYNSISHHLINELVGTAGPLAKEESSNASLMTVLREDVKHSESNTTNHSTGDSQNSSSAEKAETRRVGLLPEEGDSCSGSTSSSGSDDEAAICVPNESLRSFITDSPFSFRNPIFFSVPRDQQQHSKKTAPVNSRRQLFFGDDLRQAGVLPPKPHEINHHQ
jgi:hypothetical protein